MAVYAKVVNGKLVEMKLPLVYDGMKFFNPTDDIIAEAGFKPIVEIGKQYGRGKYCEEIKTISDTPTAILIDYTYKYDIEKGKSVLLERLADRVNTAYKTNIIESSLGFPVEARKDDLMNIDGTLCILAKAGDTDIFRDANNEFREIKKSDFKTLKKEIIESHARIRKNKWDLEKKISEVKTLEEFDNFEIKL